jgi:Concanavalin A-like lectin/glucanases superfamily
MAKKPVHDDRMSFEIFGAKIEARTPIALALLLAVLVVVTFWYWPQIRERLPDNLVGLEPLKPYTLLCALRFEKPGSGCSGWNEENVARSEGKLFCTPSDRLYRAVYYVFDLQPASFSFSIRFKANDFEAPSASNNFDGKNNIITLGEGSRWFALRENIGRIEVTANNGRLAQVLNGARISAGTWYNIFVSVDELKKRVVLLLDGTNSFEYALPENFRFSVHRILDSEPLEAGFSLIDRGDNNRFVGCVDYLYVYSRAMSIAEMKDAVRLQGKDAP